VTRPAIASVATPAAPAPNGHYSQAIVFGELVFLSAQLPLDPDGAIPADVSAQALQALANCGAILDAAGSGLDQVLSVTLYLADVAHWASVDRAFAAVLGDHRPARAMVPVPALHLGAQVAAQMIAARRSPS